MLEVAQIARAFRSMRFTNPKLSRALSKSFLSLEVGELNPLSVCNLLYDCMQLGIRQGKMTDRMVRPRLVPWEHACVPVRFSAFLTTGARLPRPNLAKLGPVHFWTGSCMRGHIVT